jgi:hypothetical protein
MDMIRIKEAESILDLAMESISASDIVDFGRTIKGKSNNKNLENKFQEVLTSRLNDFSKGSHWSWEREIRIDIISLRNIRDMSIDIVGFNYAKGVAIAIELKYVTKIQGLEKTSDNPSFPWDVLKDCIKIESVMSSTEDCGISFQPKRATSKQTKTDFEIIYGFSIGLTNFQPFWEGKRNNAGELIMMWAGEFHKATIDNNEPIKGMYHNTTKNLENSIWKNKRHHLSFGFTWEKAWHECSSTKNSAEIEVFKYIKLKPCSKVDKPSYQHKWDDIDYLPFGSKRLFDLAQEKAIKFKN